MFVLYYLTKYKPKKSKKMANIDFNKEMAFVKLKMMEDGLTLPLSVGPQIKNLQYSELKQISKDYILTNMRRFQNAFSEFIDPEVPELNVIGSLTRKEMYFALRSVYLEKKAVENADKAEAIQIKLNTMKPKSQIRKELEAEKAELLKGTK